MLTDMIFHMRVLTVANMDYAMDLAGVKKGLAPQDAFRLMIT